MYDMHIRDWKSQDSLNRAVWDPMRSKQEPNYAHEVFPDRVGPAGEHEVIALFDSKATTIRIVKVVLWHKITLQVHANKGIVPGDFIDRGWRPWNKHLNVVGEDRRCTARKTLVLHGDF